MKAPEEISAFPLEWPIGYKRTDKRRSSAFKVTPGRAQDFLREEIKRLGGSNLVVSSNVMIRKDGLLYSDMSDSVLDDPGVAIYFNHEGQPISLCCDSYTRPWENLHAIARTVEALRQISRDGVSDFLKRAFTGFKALPESTLHFNCWDVLNMKETKDATLITKQYKIRVRSAHPDTGGSTEKFQQLNQAYQEALKYAHS